MSLEARACAVEVMLQNDAVNDPFFDWRAPSAFACRAWSPEDG